MARHCTNSSSSCAHRRHACAAAGRHRQHSAVDGLGSVLAGKRYARLQRYRLVSAQSSCLLRHLHAPGSAGPRPSGWHPASACPPVWRQPSAHPPRRQARHRPSGGGGGTNPALDSLLCAGHAVLCSRCSRQGGSAPRMMPAGVPSISRGRGWPGARALQNAPALPAGQNFCPCPYLVCRGRS